MTPAVELAQYLADNGVGARGGDADWGIHVSREPTAPDNVNTLYDTGGSEPDVIDISLRVQAIQVRTRSADYVAGYTKQDEIFTLLAQPDGVLGVAPLERNIGAHRYIGIRLTGDITFIGRDDNDRFLFTSNYELHRQPLEE
jgi:hypothetical protein